MSREAIPTAVTSRTASRRRGTLIMALLAVLALAVALGGVAVAQDEPAPETPPAETPPAETPPADAPPVEAPAATPPAAGEDQPVVGTVGKGEAPADDPADDVVKHVKGMTRIVRDHIDEPDKVKTDLKAYIDENGAAMKEAGDRFEARLNDLPADEREAYKEKLQRKMETALADFLEAMLDFSERHPEAARELDEMLQAAQ